MHNLTTAFVLSFCRRVYSSWTLCDGNTLLSFSPIIHKNLPFNGSINVQLQTILLYCHEHEGNHATAECIGRFFNEISTPSARLVHFCKIEISVVDVDESHTPHSPNIRTVAAESQIPRSCPDNVSGNVFPPRP